MIKISEKQVLGLITLAEDYLKKIEIMIMNGLASGQPMELMETISKLLYQIREQQSERLYEIE